MLYFWFLSLFGGNLDFWSDFSGLPTQIVRGRSSRFLLHLSKQESQQLQKKLLYLITVDTRTHAYQTLAVFISSCLGPRHKK